jgi:hypothetical protein
MAAVLPREEAATDTAASASMALLTRGGVIRREPSTRRRLPVRTPTPYVAVPTSNQAETKMPRRRTSAVNVGSGLDWRSHVAKCHRSTDPSRPLASTKKTSKTISHTRTPRASK